MHALHSVLPPVDSLLLFSSTSSVWSQTGSAHYAAANAYLDAAASVRHHAGLPATSVQVCCCNRSCR